MSYAQDHADALADIREAGASVTFTRETPSPAYDPETGVMGGFSSTTIPGYAIEVPADPIRYRELNLVVGTMPTLLFAPNTYGATPAPGDTLTWAGQAMAVKHVKPLRLDGTTIIADVVVGV